MGADTAGWAPRLYLITDRHATAGRPLTGVVRAALGGLPPAARGSVAVSLREKDLEARALLQLARELRDVTAPAGAKLFVNDRVDVALAAGADGVHLGGRSLSPADVARVAPGLMVGVSTHGRSQVGDAAGHANVAFAVFGPVYDTPSKRAYGPPVGLGALRDANAAGLPLLALGGVTPERASECLGAGAFGIACIRAVLEAADPAEAFGALWTTVEKAYVGNHRRT
jgi:thiamine-phosphate pyrophosphorylase